jgi:hypothetical protein
MYGLKVIVLFTLCDIHSMKTIDLTSTCSIDTSVKQINHDARNEKLDKE